MHPYESYKNQTSIENMTKIEVTLQMCTFFKGVPFGLTIMRYKDPHSKSLSFKGIGVLNQGKLHETPFICIDDYGNANLFSRMIDGRPAEDSYCTWFYDSHAKQNVYSLKHQTRVSGCQYFSGQMNVEGKPHGFAKKWKEDGSIFCGYYDFGWRVEGKEYILRPEAKHNLFYVEYDYEGHEFWKEYGGIVNKIV